MNYKSINRNKSFLSRNLSIVYHIFTYIQSEYYTDYHIVATYYCIDKI